MHFFLPVHSLSHIFILSIVIIVIIIFLLSLFPLLTHSFYLPPFFFYLLVFISFPSFSYTWFTFSFLPPSFLFSLCPLFLFLLSPFFSAFLLPLGLDFPSLPFLPTLVFPSTSFPSLLSFFCPYTE